MKRRFAALILSLVVGMNLIWTQAAYGAVDYKTVRVYLSSMGAPSDVTMRLQGSYTIREKPEILLENLNCKIMLAGKQLILTDEQTLLYPLGEKFTLVPVENSVTHTIGILNSSYGWTNYPGVMEVEKVDEGIRLVNQVDLETYLYGVVPYEMGNSWPLEALKAQAVAARTYAARSIRSTSFFDLYDTEYSQVYKGYNGAKANAIKAVQETRGKVLMYMTDFAATYYSASNGGYTESTANLWGSSVPYLVVKQDSYDIGNPRNSSASWKVAFSKLAVDPAFQLRLKVRISSALEAMGYSGSMEDIIIKQIKELSFNPPNTSGRVNQGRIIVILDAKKKDDGQIETLEQTINLNKGNTRSILNVKSLLFAVEDAGDQYILRGSGYGHGVGMSQVGAQQMADEGLSYAQILEFYYPGTQLVSLWPEENGSSGDASRGDEERPPIEQPSDDQQSDGDVQPQQPSEDQNTGDSSTQEPSEDPNTDGSSQQEPAEGQDTEDPSAEQPGGDTDTPEDVETGDGQSQQPGTPGDQETGQPSEGGDSQEPSDSGGTAQPGGETSEPQPLYGTVNVATALNMRQGPGTQYQRVGLLSPNTRVKVLEQGEIWLKIQMGDSQGYVHRDYIKLEDTTQAEPQTPAQDDTQAPPADAVPPPANDKYGIVTASALNVRSGPSTRNHKVGMVIKGSKLNIQEAQDGWYKIDYNGLAGYVSADYISMEEPSTPQQPAPESLGKAIVAASVLNVRSGSGLSYDRIGILTRNATVDLLESSEGWYKIQSGSLVGYVHGDYIQRMSLGRGVVTANALNVRNGAGIEHERIGSIQKDAQVEILEHADGWYKVQHESMTGYVSGDYIKLIS